MENNFIEILPAVQCVLLGPFFLGNSVLLKWSYKGFLLLHSLEATMTKFGGGVNKFEVSLPQGLPFGLHQQGLARSEHWLLGSRHTAFERDKVTGHLPVEDEAAQRVDALIRQIVISRGIVLDPFAALDEVALTDLVHLLVDLSAVMVAFLPSPSPEKATRAGCHAPVQATLCSPRWVLRGSFLVSHRLVTPL